MNDRAATDPRPAGLLARFGGERPPAPDWFRWALDAAPERIFIEAAGARIYFAGDTAYGPFFTDVAGRLGRLDLALMPIGAYEPRWFMQAVHMDPAEAVRAHLDLDARQSVGMHFGTFRLTAEGIDEPLRALDESLRVHDIPPSRFRALEFGESMRLP